MDTTRQKETMNRIDPSHVRDKVQDEIRSTTANVVERLHWAAEVLEGPGGRTRDELIAAAEILETFADIDKAWRARKMVEALELAPELGTIPAWRNISDTFWRDYEDGDAEVVLEEYQGRPEVVVELVDSQTLARALTLALVAAVAIVGGSYVFILAVVSLGRAFL